MTNDKFNQDFYDEMSDGMLMTYLASMTKAAAKVITVLDLHDNFMDSKGGRGGRGIRRQYV